MPAEALPESHDVVAEAASFSVAGITAPDGSATPPGGLSAEELSVAPVPITSSTESGSDPRVPLVTVDDLAVYGVLVDLDEATRAAITAHLAGLVGTLELALRRPVEVRQFTDAVTVGQDGRVWLTQTPVTGIVSVTANGQQVAGVDDPRAFFWHPGTALTVVYTAGLDPAKQTMLRSVVVAKALPWVRSLLARRAAPPATGGTPAGGALPALTPGVKSFNVEGLSVTYESTSEAVEAAVKAAQAEAALAAWTPEELAPLSLLRKVVVA